MSINIDYMITAKCNLSCPFCYGPDPKLKGELKLHEKLILMDFFMEKGVETIVIAGGEPLVSPDLLPLLQYLHGKKIKVAVQTNAYLQNKVRQIAPYLDWIAMPFDAADRTTHHFMRTTDKQQENTEASARAAREANPSIKLKIGTVVTKQNAHQLVEIGHLVKAIRPDIWKLYEVRPRGQALENIEEMRIDQVKIEGFLEEVFATHADLAIHYSACEVTDRAYLIINPDGECLIPHGTDYLPAGHLVRNGSNVSHEAWEAALSLLNYESHSINVKNSFPHWKET